jgi:hypothetical protein
MVYHLTSVPLCSMKLDKGIVQRRIDLMAAEGIVCQIPLFSSSDLLLMGIYLVDLRSECKCWC